MGSKWLFRLAVGCFAAGPLFAVGGLWWWAVAGMSEEIAVAVGATAIALTFGGLLLVALGDIADRGSL